MSTESNIPPWWSNNIEKTAISIRRLGYAFYETGNFGVSDKFTQMVEKTFNIASTLESIQQIVEPVPATFGPVQIKLRNMIEDLTSLGTSYNMIGNKTVGNSLTMFS